MKLQINPIILINFDPKVADKRFSSFQQEDWGMLADDFITVVSVDDFRKGNTLESDLIAK